MRSDVIRHLLAGSRVRPGEILLFLRGAARPRRDPLPLPAGSLRLGEIPPACPLHRCRLGSLCPYDFFLSLACGH